MLKEVSRCFDEVLMLFQGCFNEVSRVFQGSLKRVLRVFQGSFKKFQGRFKEDSRKFQGYFLEVESLKIISSEFKWYFECVSRVFQVSLNVVSRPVEMVC